MKKIFSFLLLGLLLSIGNIWAAEEVCYTLTPASGSNNGYANNCDIAISGITWNLTGNSQMQPWRIGGKSLSSVDRNLYSKTAISNNVSKIEVTHGAASGITVNSWTVIVSKNADFSSPVSTLTPTFEASTTTTINRPDGKDWSNCYYKFVYNVSVTVSSNKFIEFTSAVFYETTGGGETPTCVMPTFSPAAGVYTSAQNVTITTTTEGATIYYTTDGTDPVTQGVVYANPISVSSSTQIKAVAKKEGSNNSTIASATFAILDHAGTQADPYTVADARSAIDLEIGKASVYAIGIVSEIVTAYGYNNYQNVTFNFSSDGETTSAQLQAFRCVGDDADEVAVGDVVVVSGNLIKYNETYEFAQGCEVVSLQHPIVSTPSIDLSAEEINAAAAETEGTISVTYNNITEVDADLVWYTDETATVTTTEPTWISAELNASNNVDYVIAANTGAARTAYLKVYALDDEANDVYSELITISQDAYVPAANYVIVTDAADIMPGAHYIIASGTNGDIKIMGEQRNNNRGVQNVTAVDGVINIPAGADTHEFVICKDGDLFAIYEAGVGYLYAASPSSNNLKSQATNNVNGQWEITIDGEDSVASIIAKESSNRNVMRYNSGSTIFASYASATQSDVYLYRKTGESFTTETVTVSDVGYATLYYGTENLIVPEGVVARTYKVESGALVETETYEAGEVVPKTIAVVLEGAEGFYDFIVTPVPGMGPAATNLKGSDVATTTTGGAYYYGLSLNSANEANSVGFYWMAAGGVAFTNGAHKAYLAVDELPASAPERILFHDNNATNIQNVEGAEKAVKFMENGQLYILKNGVVYDAMGKTVR